MKSNGEKGFYGKTTVNILYSFMITMAILILPAGYINGLIKSWADSQARNPGGYTLTGFGPALILLFALFGLFIFIVIFWTFQKRSLAYIERLTEGIAGIAAGDLGTNLEVRGEDEFAGMAQNLNAMVERIQVLMDKEREAEKSKNELITNIAHDLRTPLTSIIGYLELLSSHKEMTEETREKYTKIAYTKAKRLEDLIEDLFGLTKLSYGKMTMHISQVDIVKLIAQLMEEFYPSFAESRLAFALTSNVESLLINADPNLIARLFDNLINNAIKYGVDGKRVDVSIERLDNQVIITVTN